MDTRIPLMVQPIDFVGSMAAGNQLAAQTNQLRDQNALRDVYRTQGAGILQGNQSSLNALAALDPITALNAQGNVLQNRNAERSFEIMNAQEKRAIAEAAAQMDEKQRAQAAEAVKREVFKFIAAPSPEVFDQLVTQAGKPELVGQWANRQVLGAEYVSSVEEALKLGAGPEPMNPSERFKVVGSSLFDLAAPGGPAPIGQGAMPQETIFGPDGKPMIIRGGVGADVKFTEGQSKDNVYATRARGALQTLDPIAGELASVTQRAANADPTGVIRGAVQSDTFQIAQQAGEEFLQAILRKDTGAAITADEQELYGKTYLPQPGDNEAVLAAKAASRQRAIAAIEAGMNLDQITATERALVNAAANSSAATPSGPRRLRYNPATGALE